MEVKIWGTRGSLAIPSDNAMLYGGNTTCLEVRLDSGHRIILDAGSGIRNLGETMMAETQGGSCTLCLSHGHWDHLLGLPFFAPLYSPLWTINIYGLGRAVERGDIGDALQAVTPCPPNDMRRHRQNQLEGTLRSLFNGRQFPVRFDDLAARITLMPIAAGESFQISTAHISTCATNHPGGCVAFRIRADGWTFVFTGDHEEDRESAPELCAGLADFLCGADVALVDGQYNAESYLPHRGHGHSAVEVWPPMAARAGVKRLYITHFDPGSNDDSLDAARIRLQQEFSALPVHTELAREGMRLSATGEVFQLRPAQDMPPGIWEFYRSVARFSDTNMILDSILSETRRITGADAGTIYLVDGSDLVFSYTQNDTLFPGSAANKHIYLKSVLPLNTRSIAGYVACTAKPLNIQDAYAIPSDRPYTFNATFDELVHYKTRSLLTLPFVNRQNKVLGVLQLINPRKEGNHLPFSSDEEHTVMYLATLCTEYIERGIMSKEGILRMNQIASLRDPRETADHVMRVGALSAELYHRWAEKNGVDMETLRSRKDLIRLAAMLHDVGKVGIPDAILRKPGPLTPEERLEMQKHSALGARLFAQSSTELDKLAFSIALHHHQRWDGKGYTGDPEFPLLAREDIPLPARVTAVADVFDALVSRRCYKEAWAMEEALETLKKDSGTHFDPALIECFMEIQDVVQAIRERFPNQE